MWGITQRFGTAIDIEQHGNWHRWTQDRNPHCKAEARQPGETGTRHCDGIGRRIRPVRSLRRASKPMSRVQLPCSCEFKSRQCHFSPDVVAVACESVIGLFRVRVSAGLLLIVGVDSDTHGDRLLVKDASWTRRHHNSVRQHSRCNSYTINFLQSTKSLDRRRGREDSDGSQSRDRWRFRSRESPI